MGEPATWAVETTLFRGLVVVRGVVLVNSLLVNLLKWPDLARPGLAAAGLVVMVAWTGFVTWAYDAPHRRRPGLFAADLAVAATLVAISPLVHGARLTDLSTVPSFWVMAAVLAWGVHWHWSGGLVAAVVVSAADLLVRDEITGPNLGNVFLLLLGGPVVGYTAGLLQQMAAAREHAERRAAAAAERARLARAVHDGVLQVLTLVQRRGQELGGEAAELGRLAGEQEVALRTLVQHGPAADPADTPSGELDLATALAGLASPRVTVALPGHPVPLPASDAAELLAVVRACLDNVPRHVGADAPAWVLLEDEPDRLVVTVRDDGPGIPDGRLGEAAAEGRLGVTESICGRMADLGGEALLSTAPGQGTEWELVLPLGHRTGGAGEAGPSSAPGSVPW